jgi:hypothetical protein
MFISILINLFSIFFNKITLTSFSGLYTLNGFHTQPINGISRNSKNLVLFEPERFVLNERNYVEEELK